MFGTRRRRRRCTLQELLCTPHTPPKNKRRKKKGFEGGEMLRLLQPHMDLRDDEDEDSEEEARGEDEETRAANPFPAQIMALPNADKTFHEAWDEQRDPLDFPHPFRMVCASKPNCGKTNFIKNMLCRVQDGEYPFEKLIIVHVDEHTREYDQLRCVLTTRIPAVEEFRREFKTLVICEDLDYGALDRDSRSNLDRLFGYTSTHENVSVVVTGQNFFKIPTNIRQCTNIYVLWNNHDKPMMKLIAGKIGMADTELASQMSTWCPQKHDFLLLDLTKDSPMPLRINGYRPLHIEATPTTTTSTSESPSKKRRRPRARAAT